MKLLVVGLVLMVVEAAAGAQFEARLRWTPNTDADLAHYNAYRSDAATSGGWRRMNAAPIRAAAYVDSVDGFRRTVRYAVSAVDAAGNESARSEVVAFTTDGGIYLRPPVERTPKVLAFPRVEKTPVVGADVEPVLSGGGGRRMSIGDRLLMSMAFCVLPLMLFLIALSKLLE